MLSNFLHKQYLILIISILCIGSILGQYNNAWKTISYDKCAATLTVSFRYLDKSGTEDDYLNSVYIRFDNDNFFTLLYKGKGNCNGEDICITEGGTNRKFDYYNGNNSTTTVQTTGDADQHYKITVTLKDIDPASLDGNMSVEFEGNWQKNGEDGQDDDFSFSEQEETNNITTPTGLIASQNAYCDKVHLSWTNPDFGCNTNWKTKIYRGLKENGLDAEYIDEVGLGIAEYDDLSAEQNTVYYYRLRRQWNPNTLLAIHTPYTSSVQGSRTPVPSAPLNVLLISTTVPCDSAIGLSWDAPIAQPDNYIVRRKSANTDWFTLDTISGSLTNYTDTLGLRKDSTYSYKLKSSNDCGVSGYSSVVSGSAVFPPNLPSNFSAMPDGDHIVLTWTDNALDETAYLLSRQGGFQFQADLDPNITSYTDIDATFCQDYIYTLKVAGTCFESGFGDDTIHVSISRDISSTFPENAFDASKGYYPDKIILEWSLNTVSDLDGINIERRQLSQLNSSFNLIATAISGSNFFVDLNSQAGELYEYRIIGKATCDNAIIYSDTSYAIGFRSKSGTVTGQVNYSGGIAVPDVQIRATSQSGISNNSLHMDGSGHLLIKDNASLDHQENFLFECWLKLDADAYEQDFTLFDKDGSYRLKYIHSGDVYRFRFDGHNYNLDASNIQLIEFTHFAIQINPEAGGKVHFFINGNLVQSHDIIGSGNITNTYADLVIGDNFKGNLCELRIWNTNKTATSISQDFQRAMLGNETGLIVYLNMKEGVGEWAYDASSSGSTFNKNHASFEGSGIVWSNDIPTASQLGNIAYTDQNGNYLLNVPFHGNGETFTILPAFGVHTFNPATTALFIGDGSFVHNNINFIDQSSFEVTGSVQYYNSSCGVADASIYVDGQALISNGQIAKTDANGLFHVRVPIGEHYISIQQTGHTYSINRFPATGTFNFQDPVNGLMFVDSTFLKVVGRVVGGLREANKIPGLGKSKNNIGNAQLILTSQSGNGCYKDTIDTNTSTGEFIAYLPPLKYVPGITMVPFNPEISDYFDVLDLVDLTGSTTETTLIDSLFDFDGDFIQSSPSITFHKRLDYTYLVDKPIITVLDPDGVSPFIGDETYTDPQGTEHDLRVNPFRWPIMHQEGDDHFYRCLIKVYEEYTNQNTGSKDSVPVTNAKLLINNELADIQSLELETSQFNTLDSIKTLIYTFKPGTPNFNTNISFPEYDFTGKLQMELEYPDGRIIPWLPNTTGDQIYRYYLLGSRSNGAQFVTEGPQIPEYVLRDPPGTESSAKRTVESKRVEKATWKWELGSEVHISDHLHLGALFTTGVGVATVSQFVNDTEGGFKASITGGRNGVQSVETVNTKEWSTYAGTAISPGANSDLYIGKSKNIQFGISEELIIMPNSYVDSIEAIGSVDRPGTGFTFGKKYGLSIVPGGYETQFMFNEYDIKNLIIPNLISLRNIYLQTNPKFTSHLPITDENYGKNNDDPVFGLSASTFTPHINETADLSGPSYTADLGVSPSIATLFNFIDSVRYFNNQIEQWENAVYLNEWEKVNIGNKAIRDSLEEVQLQNLYQEYETVIGLYLAAVAANGVGGVVVAYGLLTTPVPGSAFAGYVAFAVTTATSIVTAELAEEFEFYLAKRQRIIDKFNSFDTPINYTLTGGTNITSSESQSAAIEVNNTIEYAIGAEMKFTSTNKISNNGYTFERGIEINYTSGREWGHEDSENETVEFSLNDPDIGDLYSVDVFPSMLGWGPIFKNRPGGATSCPYEPAQITEYYNPGDTMSQRTLQIDKPEMSVSPSKLSNIPVTEAAVYNLTIHNKSEIGYTMAYDISVVGQSNPFGAIVKIDGFSSSSVVVAGGTSINKVLTIEKGPGPTYNYDSIIVVVHSQCQFTGGAGFISDIEYPIFVSAHFLPSCTDVKMSTPDNQWVLNNSFNDTLPVAINGYNINYFDLENLRVDYKPSSSAKWIGLKTYLKDTSGLNDPGISPIPQDKSFTLYNWDVSQLTDGNYDLRIVSNCTLADKKSNIHTGVIDRINPHAFGNPSPADGILSPNDELSIRFNEPIDLGSISQTSNFDIRGVFNGTKSDHFTSLSFDGVNDYLEISDGLSLNERDFSIEFSIKRNGTGDQVIFSQGVNDAEKLVIGFNASNKLYFSINGTTVQSDSIFTDSRWHNIAISYDYDLEKVEMFLANQITTAKLINGASSIFVDYIGTGEIQIGKNSVTNSAFFKGNIHDLRIWDRAISLSSFAANKSKILSGSEAGILYNWKMDEATGLITKDNLKSRDAEINGAIWQITPNGSAVQLDGINDYLKTESGNVAITEEMDFTIEFWFKSNQGTAATLFSNGTGSNIAGDSLYSWIISKDEAGLIHILHNGIDYIATTTNYFDGQWRHFAMVFQRNANLTCYIDGNFESSTDASSYKYFGGGFVYLGSTGYYQNQTEITNNYFNGQLDEFRFWNCSRKLNQIQRDKQFRLKGDEPGLKLYLPFESYAIDPTGFPILTPGFQDQSPDAHVTNNPNGAITVSTTPTIKIQRPTTEINFTYSVNNDQIIFTPLTAPDLIENVTLDITVQGIKDLHGNVMQSPVTWIAYMDKNQVVWQDDLLKYAINQGETLTFKSGVFNKGGAAKKFNILDLPSWLTVSPSSGIIEPNSSIEVVFTINPNINLGQYNIDVSLLTDFNFREKLAIDLLVNAIAPDWKVDPAKYEFTMSIVGTLKINGINSIDVRDKIVAMIGQEVRGVANLEYVPSIDAYRVFLNVYNTEKNPMIAFRIWDASTGKVYSEVTPSNILFTTDSIRGSLLNPTVFESGSILTYELPIYSGWNWLTFFLDNTSNEIDTVLVSVAEDKATVKTMALIKNNKPPELVVSDCNANNSWNGSLKGDVLIPTNNIKLQKTSNDTLVLKGTVVNPTTRTITLYKGWTWIGFVSIRQQEINAALANLTPTTGDVIKGKYNFAIYNGPALGWIGSLKTMVPGEGYMYKSLNTSNKTFKYPIAGMFDNITGNLSTRTKEDELWSVDHHPYINNMTAITKVHTSCFELLESGTFGIGVMDAAGNWRGKSPVDLIDEQAHSFLTIAGDANENLRFKLIHADKNAVFDLKHSIQFKPNEHLGSMDFPYTLEMDDFLCKNIKYNDDQFNGRFVLYPQVVKDVINIEFTAMNEDDHATLSITNMLGQEVLNKKVYLRKGFNAFIQDVSQLNGVAGSYIVRLLTKEKLYSQFIQKIN